MKTITIGRDKASNIFIDDPMISRHHALLRIHPTGKMELVDMSSNGTFVNRVKLASNVPFPLTRKDTVSFAEVRQLDWSLIPNPLAWVKWFLIGVCVVVLLLVSVLLLRNCEGSADETIYMNNTEVGSNEKSSSDSSVTGNSGSTISDDSTKSNKDADATDKKESGKSEASDTGNENVEETKGKASWHEKEVQDAKRAEEAARRAAAQKAKKSDKDASKKSDSKKQTNKNDNSYIEI